MHERRQYSPYGYKRVGAGWMPLPGNGYGIMERPMPVSNPRMDFRPECDCCNIANHGFVCHFSDGSCLRTIQENGGPDYGIGDLPEYEHGEAGYL